MWLTAFLEWLLTISNIAVPIFTNLMVQSTILSLMGLYAAYTFRNKSAIFQSLILRAFLAAALICPLISVIIDATGMTGIIFDIPLASSSQTEPQSFYGNAKYGTITPKSSVPRGESNLPEDTFQTSIERVYAGSQEQSMFTIDTSRKYSGGQLFIELNRSFIRSLKKNFSFITSLDRRAVLYIAVTALWMVCTLFYLARLVLYYFRIFYVRRTALYAELSVNEECRKLAHQLEIEPPIVLESSLVKSPYVTGFIKPAVFMPQGLTASHEILLHELAHLVRSDFIWNLLSHIGIALLPLQPFMRVLSRRIEITSDYVCDDYVVKHSRNPRSYAFQLYHLARRFQPAASEQVVTTGIFSSRSSLRSRIERILADSRQILVAAKAGFVLYVMCISLIATILAGLIGFRGISMADKAGFYNNIQKIITPLSFSLTMNLENDIAHFLEPQKQLNNTHLNSPEASENELLSEPPIQTGDNQEIENDSVITNNQIDEITHDQGESELEQHLMPLRDDVSEQAYSDIINDYAGPESTDEQPVLLTLNDQIESFEPVLETPSGLKKAIPVERGIDPETITDIATCKKIGRELIYYGYYAKAEQVFYRAVQFDPNDHEVRYYLGKIYSTMHDDDLARLYFKMAISLKPDYAKAYYNLGNLFQSRGDMESAWSYYKVAIELNPAYTRKRSTFVKL